MKDEHRFIDRYNHGISELDSAYKASEKKDISLLQEKLHNSATAVYEAYEWILNGLVDRLKKQIHNSHKNVSDLNVLKNKGDKNYYKNIVPIINKHCNLLSKDIHLELISENKPKVRNLAVHEGAIPNHSSLIITIMEIAKFISHVCPSAILDSIPSVNDTSFWIDEL